MRRQADKAPERTHDCLERERPASGPVAEQARRQVHTTTARSRGAELTNEQQNMLREAMTYCLRHFPMLWTTGGLPEERVGDDGSRQWIIHVYLRYPTGFEGYLGDLLYDGRQFTELTDREIMQQRAKQIEADPALQREWDEYRASTLPTRNA